jgi:hypothetical protein
MGTELGSAFNEAGFAAWIILTVPYAAAKPVWNYLVPDREQRIQVGVLLAAGYCLKNSPWPPLAQGS